MNTLKKGSKGDEVKQLQTLLGVAQDGIFGSATESVVKNFQVSHGLAVDGIVGPNTWKALTGNSETPSNIEEIKIISKFLSKHITSSPNREIKYITIHYTAGGSSLPGSAQAIYNVFSQRSASADFAVDDRDIVQFNPDLKNYYCWAIGDKGVGTLKSQVMNRNTISIEICSNLKKGTSAAVPNHSGWTFTDASLKNALNLTKYLMKKYNIPRDRVIRHYDVTGKYCPGIVGWNDGTIYDTTGNVTKDKNNSSCWTKFKNNLIVK
jgi:N-acetylmuramoyl-L-alanine amidase CwlA